MRKILILTFLTFLLSEYFFPQVLNIEREIDLSFFLRPKEPHRVMLGVDNEGNIFITQERKEEFLKLNPQGKIIFRGPLKVEGEIHYFGVDSSGNPVCFFSPRMEGNNCIFPLVWFDGKNGKRIKEINLCDLFELITFLRILQPQNIILINGIIKNENFRKYSLHTIDFNGRHLKSFSPVKDPSNIRGEKNREYFQHYTFLIDSRNKRILQGLPFSEKMIVRVFDYWGNKIDEISLQHGGFYRSIPDENGIWIYNGKMEYEFFSFLKGKYSPTGKKMLKERGDYFLESDRLGNLYFAGGESSQILRVYRIKE